MILGEKGIKTPPTLMIWEVEENCNLGIANEKEKTASQPIDGKEADDF